MTVLECLSQIVEIKRDQYLRALELSQRMEGAISVNDLQDYQVVWLQAELELARELSAGPKPAAD